MQRTKFNIINTAAVMIVIFAIDAAIFDLSANPVNAEQCIIISGEKNIGSDRGHILKNVCTQRVHIYYCHSGSSKRRKERSRCGASKSYYKSNHSFPPGATKDNIYNLPADGRIEWIACYASEKRKFTVRKPRGKNSFDCKPIK